MPQVNNVNFPKNKLALLFLHTTENNFGKQKQHVGSLYCAQYEPRSDC